MLIYSMSTSVDGFIADREGAFEWTAASEELFRFHTALVSELGAYLCGRRLTRRCWCGRRTRRCARTTSGPRSQTSGAKSEGRLQPSDSDPRGRVRFQSGYREADLGPDSDPGEPWLPPPRTLRRRRPRQRRCPSRAAWAVVIARGSIAEAVAYIGSGRLLATGLGSCFSSL